MKPIKYIAAATIALALVAAGCSSDSDDTSYIQASASFDQMESGRVQFDTNDGSSGVNMADSTFKVSEDGVYFIVAAPQIGGINGEAEAGCANLWIAVNDVDVENSNIQYCNSQKTDGTVLVSQGVVPLAADDVVTVEWSTTGPALEAIEVDGAPLVPSVIFSLLQVG